MTSPKRPTVRVWTTNQEAPGKTTIPGFLGGTPIAVLAGFDLTSALFVVAQRPSIDHWTRAAGLSSAGFLVASAILIGALAFAGRAQFVLITPDQARSWWPELALNENELRKIREVVAASQDRVDRLIKRAATGWLLGLWLTAAAFGLGAWSYGVDHAMLLVGEALAAVILFAASWVFVGEEHLRPGPVSPLTPEAEQLLHDDRFGAFNTVLPPLLAQGDAMTAEQSGTPTVSARASMSVPPAKPGMLIIRALIPAVFLSGIVYGLIHILNHDDHDHAGRAVVFGSAVLLIVFLLLELVKPPNDVTKKSRQYGWTTVLFGADGRLSTSKTQVFLWTIGLAYAAAFLTGVQIFVRDGVFDNSNWNDYLILLGGPFAAAVLAKYTVVTKLNAGTLDKSMTGAASASAAGSAAPTLAAPAATDVVADDNGNLDLVDTQYFMFNIVAFAYAAGVFLAHNFDHTMTVQTGKYTLPAIPSVLLALTGASAATYVGNKMAQKDSPAISAVSPNKDVHADDLLTITGVNLVPTATPSDSAASQTWVWISPITGAAQQVLSTLATPTMVRFQMPPSYEGQTVQVIEASAGAVPTAPYPIEVAPST